MQQRRAKSLLSASKTPGGAAELVLRSALRRKSCVTANYNRGSVLLAPHLLYLRHDELHLAAVTLKRNGERPKQERMSVYKVSGLGEVQAEPSPFTPRLDLLSALDHNVDDTLASVSAADAA